MMKRRLMTWNLLEGGRGADGHRLDLCAEVIRNCRPDVLFACEAHGLAEDERLLGDIAAAVGMRARIVRSPDGAHLALLVRPSVAVTHFEAIPLGGERPAILAVLRSAGLPDMLLGGCHLDARDPTRRLSEVRALLSVLRAPWPRILLGDFNQISHEDGLTRRDLLNLPLHHVERHVAPDGEPDTRVTQEIAAAGFVDAWRLAHAGGEARLGHTVPTAVPQPPRFAGMRLDYIYLSADIPAALTACDVWREKPAPRASDHFPLIAELEPHGP